MMHVTAIVLQIFLGVAFLLFGLMNLVAKRQIDEFEHLRYPQWFRVVTGLVEVMGGVGMIVGIWSSVIAVLAGLWLAITMLVAAISHIRIKDPAKALPFPILLLILSVLVSVLNSIH